MVQEKSRCSNSCSVRLTIDGYFIENLIFFYGDSKRLDANNIAGSKRAT